MAARDDRIRKEAKALWEAFSDKPAPDAPPSQILERALRLSGLAEYERINSPWLRPEAITWAIYKSETSEGD